MAQGASMQIPPHLMSDGMLIASTLGARGYDTRAICRAANAGTLVRLARGVYVDAAVWLSAVPREQHVMRCRATAARLGKEVVLAGPSAAAVLGLTYLGQWPERVCALNSVADGTRVRGGVSWWGHDDRSTGVIDLGWVRATNVYRTTVELSAREGYLAGLVTADSALRSAGHRGAGNGARELLTMAESLRLQRGARRVERVATFANGHSESAGESWTRVVLADLGVEQPELQVDILDDGVWLARVDFCWPGRRIVLELDGQKKYRAPLRGATRAVEDVVIEEKKREDRLRAAGWVVVRIVWDDLREPERLRRLLLRYGLIA
ncbi:MAG: hypothetical protein RL499_268 [Actinomycetota bacterium]|jgi:hypothetical protein